MTTEPDTPGSRLRSARLALGLTQRQAAEIARVSQPTIQKYETGQHKPDLQLWDVCKSLGIDPSTIDDRFAAWPRKGE